MAFNAGMAVAYYKLDDSGFQAGAKRVEKGNQSMTASMVKAGVILKALEVGLKAIVNVGKGFVQSAAQFERFEATLKTMLGTTSAARDRMKELSDFAASTPFTLPQVVEAGNQLQALGRYSQETLRDLGDLAAASGKPMEQALSAFAKMATGQKGEAVNMFRDLLISTDDWQRATGKGIKANGELVASTEEMLAALPKILQEKGFAGMMDQQSKTLEGMASNMEDAFTRTGTAIGQFFLPVIKDGIQDITNLTSTIGEFASSAEGISLISTIVTNISGGISVLKTVFGEILNVIQPVIVSIRDNLLTNMESLGLKINKTNIFLSIMTGATNILSATFRVVGVVINSIINNFSNMAKFIQEFIKIFPLMGKTIKDVFVGIIDVIKKTVDTGKALFDALSDPLNMKKWQAAKGSFDGLTKGIQDNFRIILNDGVTTAQQIGKAIDAQNKFVGGTVEGIKNIIDQTATEIKNFGASSEETYNKLMEAYKSGMIKTQKDLDDFFTVNAEETGKKQVQSTQQTMKEMTDEQKKAMEEWGRLHRSDRENAIADLNKRAESFTNAGIAEIEVEKWKNAEIKKLDDEAQRQQNQSLKEKIGGIIGYVKEGLSSLGSIITAIGQGVDQYYANQLAKVSDYYAGQKEIISANYEEQKTADEEAYNSDLAALDSQLANKEITQAQYDERKKALDEKTKIATKNLDKKYKDEQIRLEKEQLAKENDLKKKQFETNKAFTIANIWINAALAVMGFWASLASMGVAGIALAAVATAATLVVAGIQTGLVASQEFVPARETGGIVMAGQPYMTGEKGAELFMPKSDGYIFNAGQTRDIMSAGRERASNNVTINNPVIREDADIKKLAQQVNEELGKMRE